MQNTIPRRILQSLNQYIHRRLEPGGFLKAVLMNDLSGALSHADPDCLQSLKTLHHHLYWHAPSECWGNAKRVQEWLKGGPE